MVGELVDRSASRCMRMFCGRGCAWVYVWMPTKMINKYWLNGFREMNKKLSSAACFSRLGASAVFHIGIFFYADANVSEFPASADVCSALWNAESSPNLPCEEVNKLARASLYPYKTSSKV